MKDSLTQEEVKKFNDLVPRMERSVKDEVLKNIKSTTGDAQVAYIRSIINTQ